MKKISIIVLAIIMSLLHMNSSANALSLDYSNVVGAKIKFTGTGDKFEFIDSSSGWDFQITGVNDGGDLALGLYGNIGGTFTINAITTSGDRQSASVSGTGILSINDGVGYSATGDLQWVEIYTLGTGGTINAGGVVNLTNIVYSGENADLLALGSNGSVNATFNFVPALSLTYLTTDGYVKSASYSGSIAPAQVTEPTSLILLGAGLIGLVLFGNKRLKKDEKESILK